MAVLGNDEEKLVSIRDLPSGIDHHHPIAVAVERDAEIPRAVP